MKSVSKSKMVNNQHYESKSFKKFWNYILKVFDNNDFNEQIDKIRKNTALMTVDLTRPRKRGQVPLFY